jgi:hypothetical protein
MLRDRKAYDKAYDAARSGTRVEYVRRWRLKHRARRAQEERVRARNRRESKREYDRLRYQSGIKR